jgi:hypothetical protein
VEKNVGMTLPSAGERRVTSNQNSDEDWLVDGDVTCGMSKKKKKKRDWIRRKKRNSCRNESVRMEKEINLTLKKKMICVWHLIINLLFLTSRRNKRIENILPFFWHLVNRYINWTSIFLFIQETKSNHLILFFFSKSSHNNNKKNFCLQSYCSAAPFVFSREFPQPINLLLDIVRLFNVC